MRKLLILVTLMLFAVPAYAVDADTVRSYMMRDDVKELLGTSGTSGGKWTDTMIRSQLNLNCREYATLIGISKEDTILSIDDTTDYTLNSDFWTVRGVLRLSEGRKKMMRQKGIDAKAPYQKGLGEESINANQPRYFAIKDQIIIIDPPTGDSTDTFIITYNAYATTLADSSTITNIPYGGIPVVVWGTVLNCMIANREDAFVQVVLPIVQKKYMEVFNSVKAQEISSGDYDPAARPPSQ